MRAGAQRAYPKGGRFEEFRGRWSLARHSGAPQKHNAPRSRARQAWTTYKTLMPRMRANVPPPSRPAICARRRSRWACCSTSVCIPSSIGLSTPTKTRSSWSGCAHIRVFASQNRGLEFGVVAHERSRPSACSHQFTYTSLGASRVGAGALYSHSQSQRFTGYCPGTIR
jgi:hypothetical protein